MLATAMEGFNSLPIIAHLAAIGGFFVALSQLAVTLIKLFFQRKKPEKK